MADLAPAVIAVFGTLAGVGITAWLQGRALRFQMEHERLKVSAERAAAAEDDHRGHERAVLVELLGLEIGNRFENLESAEHIKQLERATALAYQVDDVVLHLIVEHTGRNAELRPRAGYVLRVPKDARTDDGHLAPRRMVEMKAKDSRERRNREAAESRRRSCVTDGSHVVDPAHGVCGQCGQI